MSDCPLSVCYNHWGIQQSLQRRRTVRCRYLPLLRYLAIVTIKESDIPLCRFCHFFVFSFHLFYQIKQIWYYWDGSFKSMHQAAYQVEESIVIGYQIFINHTDHSHDEIEPWVQVTCHARSRFRKLLQIQFCCRIDCTNWSDYLIFGANFFWKSLKIPRTDLIAVMLCCKCFFSLCHCGRLSGLNALWSASVLSPLLISPKMQSLISIRQHWKGAGVIFSGAEQVLLA